MSKRLRTMVGEVGRRTRPRSDETSSSRDPPVLNVSPVQGEDLSHRAVTPPSLTAPTPTLPDTSQDPASRSQGAVGGPAPWRFRKFTDVPSTVCFLDDAQSSHAVAREINSEADLVRTRSSGIGDLVSSLSHDVVSALIHHNALQEHHVARDLALQKLRKDVAHSASIIEGLRNEVTQVKESKFVLDETMKKHALELGEAKVEISSLMGSLGAAKKALKAAEESLAAAKASKAQALEQKEKEVREEYQALFDEAEHMIYSVGYRDGSLKAPPRKPLCDVHVNE